MIAGGLVAMAGFLLIIAGPARADGPAAALSEIMYDPEGKDAGHTDWIELYNPDGSELSIDKSDFGLIDEKDLGDKKEDGSYPDCHTIKDDLEIESGGYLVLADSPGEFADDYPDSEADVMDTVLDLSSRGDGIHLSADRCKTFFLEADYDDGWGGHDNGRTLEKKDPDGGNSEKNWQESFVKGGTPGRKSSTRDDLPKYSHTVRLNELLPNPDSEKDEFIELYNFGKDELDLGGWLVRDGSASGKYYFPTKSVVAVSGFLVVDKDESKLSLNNDSETVTLYDPNGDAVSSVVYKAAPERASYNFDGKAWRWSRFLTPSRVNRFNNLPQIKVEKDDDVYEDMPADFEAKAKDADRDKLKFIWDFGDGHKSYLKETAHTYEKKGKYKASLTVFDGSEKAIKNFTVEVKKYPHADVDLVALSPNPSGKDSEFEWIEVKNNSKKKINLKDWSLATGWKDLYNHPIYGKTVIKPGESVRIGRDMSKFSLNNKKAKIELRYPDGQRADGVKYERAESVFEDELYRKVAKKEWEWILPLAGRSESVLAVPVIPAAKVIQDDEAEPDLAGQMSQLEISPDISMVIALAGPHLIGNTKISKLSVESLDMKIDTQDGRYRLSGSLVVFPERYFRKFLRDVFDRI